MSKDLGYLRFFLSLFFSIRPNEFFQIQAYLITDFDCWLCYFHYSARLMARRATSQDRPARDAERHAADDHC